MSSLPVVDFEHCASILCSVVNHGGCVFYPELFSVNNVLQLLARQSATAPEYGEHLSRFAKLLKILRIQYNGAKVCSIACSGEMKRF